GHLPGRRARAAASRPRRGTRLEGRRPVHGHPRCRNRPDRHAATVRLARGPGPRADSRPARPGDSDAGRNGGSSLMSNDVATRITHETVQDWLDAYARAWETYDPEQIAALFSEGAEYRWHPADEPTVGRYEIVRAWVAPEGN